MSLPALPVTADTRSITERVNVLIRDYNGGRVDQLAQLADQVAGLLALASQDVTVFLGSDVALNNVSNFFDGPNTGSVGASGQKWLILAGGIIDTNSVATTGEFAIYNGSAYIASSTSVGPNANWPAAVSLAVIVTLAGPTTFTLRAKANSAAAFLRTTGLSSIANKATYITAARLS
jgi:hypothetical protein